MSIVAVGTVFPLVFSVQASFTRREKALQGLAQLKVCVCFVCVFVCVCVCVCVCVSACLSVCLSVSESVYVCVSQT